MKRRTFSSCIAVTVSSAFAGCFDLGGTGPRVSLTDTDEVGAEHPLRFDVELLSDVVGSEQSPELAISLENTAGSNLFVGYRETWPAGGLLGNRDSDPAALRLLAEPEVSDLTVDGEPCATTAYRPTVDDRLTGYRVSPGEQHRMRYVVLGSSRHLDTGCPPAGRYRFRSQYEYATADEVERVGFENADRNQFSWGFALEISDADW